MSNGLEKIKDGWFYETGTLWPGQAMGIEVDEVLFHGKSDYQDILFFKSKTYGTVFVLDGSIQVSERDQHAYAEMIAHLPIFAHPNPKKVLVIGGGDGAVLSEVVKHKSVEVAEICEIDKMCIEKSKIYYPQWANIWTHPKVKVNIADGFKFLAEHENEYDVIIVDSSDPIGPAQSLFENPFYELMFKSLREGGVISTQSECVWLHLDMIANLYKMSKEIYKSVDYAYTTIPTYPSGQIGFMLCSKGDNVLKKAKRTVKESITEDKIDSILYYNEDIHTASFILPTFALKKLQGKNNSIN
eukprot:TRINITY_DN954_c0_g1_i1.p1 TRINITY_DN954_c0_g1~~TRINITY_DN954_c0_g1_i1.p1  ORF type:complete len:300 (+),score=95.39 TRINITY_DN954_c0_g1_i1:255-1154(+)